MPLRRSGADTVLSGIRGCRVPATRTAGAGAFADANAQVAPFAPERAGRLCLCRSDMGVERGMAEVRYSIDVLQPSTLVLERRQLGSGRWLLGRGSTCGLALDARGVSREHVLIEIHPDGGATLTDQGSTNGSRVDGRVFSTCAVRGDFVLELGEVRLRFREHDPDLGALAFELPGGEVGAANTVATDLPATHTRVDEPLERLREAVGSCLCIDAGQAPGSAVLGAALEPLGACSLSLQDRNGRVLAAAGDVQHTLRPWIRGEQLVLHIDASAHPGERVSEAVRELLRWWTVRASPSPAAGSALPAFPGVAGPESPLQNRLRGVARIARSRIGVLILGESGTGKELVARWIHELSPRSDGPFVAVNCAALPRDLLEAELFGVEKGAATGVEARPGVFERAHGGTLFLDELGDMPLETQVRLLRAVEDGRIHRVGGKHLIEVDVRLLAATHADLQLAIAERRFRLDLYHRLAGFEITLPALRERPGDIAPLAFHFFRQALDHAATRSPGMTEAALRCLRGWHWPGNVRELRQVIEAASALLADGEALDASHLPPRLQACMALHAGEAAVREPVTLAEAVAEAERGAILRALDASGGEAAAAWTRLGIGKTTFYKKLREHGIQRELQDPEA